jgi:hypothetical protein
VPEVQPDLADGLPEHPMFGGLVEVHTLSRPAVPDSVASRYLIATES